MMVPGRCDGIAEVVNGVTTPEEQNVQIIMSEKLSGGKDLVACGEKRRGGAIEMDLVDGITAYI